MMPGVHLPRAGHTLAVTDGQARARHWWRPEPDPETLADTAETAGRILSAVDAPVGVHLAADVPVGGFLSSGPRPRESAPGRTTTSWSSARRSTGSSCRRSSPRNPSGTRAHPHSGSLHVRRLSTSRRSCPEKSRTSCSGATRSTGNPAVRHPSSGCQVRTCLARSTALMREGRCGKGHLARATTPPDRRSLGNVPFSDDVNFALRDPLTAAGLMPSSNPVTGCYADSAGLDEVARMQVRRSESSRRTSPGYLTPSATGWRARSARPSVTSSGRATTPACPEASSSCSSQVPAGRNHGQPGDMVRAAPGEPVRRLTA